MNMTPMGRFGTPEEIASTALFLASDDAVVLHRGDPAPLGRRVRRLIAASYREGGIDP